MRVLIAGINYRPELTAVGRYTTCLAAHIEQRSHHVVQAVSVTPIMATTIVGTGPGLIAA